MTEMWIFFSLSFLLLVTPAEFSDVVGHEPVQVTAGDDVILPCHLEPPLDVTKLTVEWKRNDRTVHVYTSRKDDHDLQDEQFRGRTSLFHSEMTKGNISLKLTNVREEDSGLYICHIPKLYSQVKRGNVLLRVNPQKDPAGRGHFIQATAGDDVILPCHLDPPFDVDDLTVVWTRNDHIVHLYRDRADKYDDQDKHFRGRTSLFPDELVKGNISLKLTNVTEDDSGRYICYVPRLNSQVKKGNVLLIVNPQKDPEGGDKKTPDDDEPTKDDQTGAIVSCVIGAVILLLLLVIGGFHFDRLKTWCNERWRREERNLEDDEERSLCESSVVTGDEPVQVTAGDDVILSCHLKPPFDVNKLTVEWTRNESIVHLYRHRADDYEDQDKQFRGRTSLFHHELVKGNISLKLTNVTEEDSGLYICSVRRLNSQIKRGHVLLRVNHFIQATAGDNVILPCHLKPPFDMDDLTVVWKRNDHNVHLYTKKADNYIPQDKQFRNRTSLFHSEMTKGNISLKLTNVTEEDSGLYFCYVRRLNSQVKKGNVLLRVNPQKDPAGRERGRNKQKDDKKREEQDAEEQIPMNPLGPVPE